MSQLDYHTRQHPGLNRPATAFRPNDLKRCNIKKDNVDTPNGLVIERKAGTKEYYVKEVTPGGLFDQMHSSRIRVGDRVVKVNDRNVDEYDGLWNVNHALSSRHEVSVHVVREGLHLEPKQEWKPAEYAPGNPPSKGGWKFLHEK